MRRILLLASIALAAVESARSPLSISGTTISHQSGDGQTHVPRSFGATAGYQLTTNGGSGDAYWAPAGGAASDSARVAGLSDSAKALVRYARTTALHDTADTLRKYTRDRIHDTSLVLRQRIADTSAALRLALTDPTEVRVIVHDTSLSIRAAIPTGGPWLPLAAGSGSPLTGALYGTGLNFTTTADAPISISHNLAGGFTHPFQAFNSGMVAGNQYNFDFGQSASTNNAANFGFKYVGAGSLSNYVTLGMYGANDLMTITAAGVPKFSGLATAGFVRANASGQLSSSALVAADIPALDAGKVTTGTFPDARIASSAAWNGKLSTVTADATSRAAKTFYAAPNGAAGAAAFRAIVAADIPTLNQNTTGSAAKWTTPRTLTIGATGKTIDGTENKSWTLAEIGAQAAGTYLGNSNVSGSTGQVAFFVGANSVGGSAGLLYSSTGANGQLTIAGGTVQTFASLVGPTQTLELYSGNGTAGIREKNPAGTTTNWPISWVPGASGQLGISRPTNMTARLYFADNAGSYITGGRNSVGDPYFYVASTNAATAGIRLLTNNGGSAVVALSAEANGDVKLPTLTGATTRLATINAAGQIGATTFTNDGPWLPTAAGSVHSPGAYSNVGPTLAIGDGQYGLSANGGSLQLWAAPGGYVATTAKLWANGAIGSGVSMSAGGGIMRAYNSGIYGIWGTGVADNNSAYSMAADNNGAWTWINGTLKSGLVVGGVERAVASASGLAVTGSLSATGALTWGGAATIPSSDYVVQGNGGGVLGHRTTNISGATATPTQSGFYDFQNPADGPQGAVWTHMIRSAYTGNATNNQWMFDIAAAFGGGNPTEGVEGYYVRTTSAGSTPGWRQLWHSGNLSASTLPGGPYLPLAGYATVTGPAYFNNLILNDKIIAGTGVFLRLAATGDIITLGSGIDWTDPIIKFTGSTTGAAFLFEGSIKSNYGAEFAGGLSGTTATMTGVVGAGILSIPNAGGAASAGTIPSGYGRYNCAGPGTWILPTPVAGQFLTVVAAYSGGFPSYVKPASGHSIKYVDLTGVGRTMTNSATTGLVIGPNDGGAMLLQATSNATWAVIGAWPQGS